VLSFELYVGRGVMGYVTVLWKQRITFWGEYKNRDGSIPLKWDAAFGDIQKAVQLFITHYNTVGESEVNWAIFYIQHHFLKGNIVLILTKILTYISGCCVSLEMIRIYVNITVLKTAFPKNVVSWHNLWGKLSCGTG
jgi:hypothetical protein